MTKKLSIQYIQYILYVSLQKERAQKQMGGGGERKSGRFRVRGSNLDLCRSRSRAGPTTGPICLGLPLSTTGKIKSFRAETRIRLYTMYRRPILVIITTVFLFFFLKRNNRYWLCGFQEGLAGFLEPWISFVDSPILVNFSGNVVDPPPFKLFLRQCCGSDLIPQSVMRLVADPPPLD